MHGEVGGADLLQAARDALLGEVVPKLSGAGRYTALMVANALGMVERELSANRRRRTADPAAPTDAATGQALCAAIRTGRHDADSRLHGALHASVIEAVAITRPEALTAAKGARIPIERDGRL